MVRIIQILLGGIFYIFLICAFILIEKVKTLRENIETIRDKAIEFRVPYSWALKKRKSYVSSVLGLYRKTINENKALLRVTSGLGAELVLDANKYWEKEFGIEKSYLEYLVTPELRRGKRITDNDIEVARGRSVIEFLPQDYAGKGNIKCLFDGHDDKRASMQVNDNFVYCHTCNKKMDVIDLVMMDRGMDFKGAVKYLARV